MSIIPCGHRVVIQLLKPEEIDPTLKTNLIYIPETDDKARREQSVDVGRVVAIGPTAFRDFGGDSWCDVNDVVAFAKYSGKAVKDFTTGEAYTVLNDEDLVCILKKGEVNE